MTNRPRIMVSFPEDGVLLNKLDDVSSKFGFTKSQLITLILDCVLTSESAELGAVNFISKVKENLEK